jgi:hypothetical protein
MPRSTVRNLARSATLAAASCLLLAGTASLPGVPAAATAVARPAAANSGTSDELRAVTCTSASNCWAVGDLIYPFSNPSEALHWGGSGWAFVPTPNPAPDGGGHDNLDGVTCVSASDCWTVGEYGTFSGQHRTLAAHWNGSTWSQVSTPDPGARTGAWTLAAVSCTAADNCWAVGHHTRPDGDNVNMALHWTGTRWSSVATPEPDQAKGGYIRQLNWVRCVSKADCWAVGSWASAPPKQVGGTEAFHWNGSVWSSVSTPKLGGGNGVACTAAANCWAVAGNDAMHWTGTRWSPVSTPQSASKQNALLGVSCAGATECWAVGILHVYGTAGAAELTDVLRWNGTKWARVTSPDPGGTAENDPDNAINELDGVACGSPTNCWAVGSYWDYKLGMRYSITLHWDGTSWSNG